MRIICHTNKSRVVCGNVYIFILLNSCSAKLIRSNKTPPEFDQATHLMTDLLVTSYGLTHQLFIFQRKCFLMTITLRSLFLWNNKSQLDTDFRRINCSWPKARGVRDWVTPIVLFNCTHVEESLGIVKSTFNKTSCLEWADDRAEGSTLSQDGFLNEYKQL